MFRKMLLLALILIFLINPSSAIREEWNKTFGGSKFDYAYSVRMTSDGGYIIAGVTNSYSESEDAWLLKIDANGNEEWNKTFGGVKEDAFYSVMQTSDGYIAAGHSKSYGNEKDIWLLKTDLNGSEEWNMTVPGLKIDIVRAILNTSENRYLVASEVNYLRFSDIFLVEIYENGSVRWNLTIGGKLGDHARSISSVKDGYIITGDRWDYIADEHYAWLLKTDLNGNEEWNRTYGGSKLDVFSAVKETSDGGYIIVGFTDSYGKGREDVWLLKTDLNGNEEWNTTLGGLLEDAAFSVEETPDGGYIVAGFTNSLGHRIFPDAWLIKLYPVGTEEIEEVNTLTENKTAEKSENEMQNPGFEIILSISGIVTGLYLYKYYFKGRKKV